MDNRTGTITLIGSGEFGDAMARVYRFILARVPETPNTVFLDTPAGFELNADAIFAKAADYFAQRLNVTLQLASFKHRTRSPALELEAALRVLRRADFIFAGPGSPSYAIKNWQATPVWEMVRARFEHGAHLVFASAAAIAVGTCALPIYEIYKAGHELYWMDGMNLFANLGMNLAVVPHWNNTEGGTYDTRYCYMGETRFMELERQLPGDTVVIGIDEYTACLFDLPAGECRVQGAGNVTVRFQGQEWTFAPGTSFSFERLRAGVLATGGDGALHAATPSPAARSLIQLARVLDTAPAPAAQRALIQQAHAEMHALASDAAPDGTLVEAPPDEAASYLLQIARALGATDEPGLKRDLLDRAHDAMHELAADEGHAANADDGAPPSPQEIAPYLDTLIEVRTQLRSAKQYALADEIRKRLADVNIVLEDSSTGTTWRRV